MDGLAVSWSDVGSNGTKDKQVRVFGGVLKGSGFDIVEWMRWDRQTIEVYREEMRMRTRLSEKLVV